MRSSSRLVRGLLRGTSLLLPMCIAACGGRTGDAEGGDRAGPAQVVAGQQAYLKVFDRAGGFGGRVVVSADGSTMAVGMAGASATVHVFSRSGARWSPQASVRAPGADFGVALALSTDGGTPAVGSRKDSSAAVHVFRRDGVGWSAPVLVKSFAAPVDATFGAAIALSGDGNTLAVGSPGESAAAGAAHLFARSGTTWSEEARVKASNARAYGRFGGAIALSYDGRTLAVGAIGEDSAAKGFDDTRVGQHDTSASGSGAAYLFSRGATDWYQYAYVKAGSPQRYAHFGTAIALSSDGNTLAVGVDGEASAAGAVHVFWRGGRAWFEALVQAEGAREFAHFGRAVSLAPDGLTLAVGAPGDSSAATGIDGDPRDKSAPSSGAAYVFSLDAGRGSPRWSQRAYVKASNTRSSASFGSALSLSSGSSGAALAVGSPGESSAATTIDGDQANTAAPGSGAVYIFR